MSERTNEQIAEGLERVAKAAHWKMLGHAPPGVLTEAAKRLRSLKSGAKHDD